MICSPSKELFLHYLCNEYSQEQSDSALLSSLVQTVFIWPSSRRNTISEQSLSQLYLRELCSSLWNQILTSNSKAGKLFVDQANLDTITLPQGILYSDATL